MCVFGGLLAPNLFVGHSEDFNKKIRRISENAKSVFGGMFAQNFYTLQRIFFGSLPHDERF